MGRIILYTAQGCRHCTSLKGVLDEHQLKYCEINIGEHLDLRKEMIEVIR